MMNLKKEKNKINFSQNDEIRLFQNQYSIKCDQEMQCEPIATQNQGTQIKQKDTKNQGIQTHWTKEITEDSEPDSQDFDFCNQVMKKVPEGWKSVNGVPWEHSPKCVLA